MNAHKFWNLDARDQLEAVECLESLKCFKNELKFWKHKDEKDFGDALKKRHLSVECRG